MADKWVERWVVPSESSDREYIVSVDAEGNYAALVSAGHTIIPGETANT